MEDLPPVPAPLLKRISLLIEAARSLVATRAGSAPADFEDELLGMKATVRRELARWLHRLRRSGAIRGDPSAVRRSKLHALAQVMVRQPELAPFIRVYIDPECRDELEEIHARLM